MALKSVLDIDIEDAKFKRFAELFSKYNEALAKQPGMWSKVGKAQGEAAKTASMMTAAMMAQADHMKEIAHAEREQQRHLTMASRLWTGIAGSAKSVAGSMLHATGTLLKWGGALLGIGGALATGTLFGLDRMAGSVANQRRSSMGLGMSIGSMKAFGTDFGRVVDPGSFLSGIMQMRTNPAMSGALWALGVNPGGSERHVAIEALNALRARAKATPDSQLGLILQELPGMQGISVEDLQRMKSMRSSEWNALMGHYARDSRSMNIGSSTALAWQNFSTQLERAGQQIFKTFVVGLGPLAKPLENLSKGFVHVIGVLMKKNGLVEEGINTFAKWIDGFNGKISTPKFLQSLEQFTSSIGELAKFLHNFAQHPFHVMRQAASRKAEDFFWNTLHPDDQFSVQSKSAVAKYKKLLAWNDSVRGLPAGTLERMWKVEAGDRFHPGTSSAGAVGPFQFLPWVANKFGINPHSPTDAAAGAAQYMQALLKQYHGRLDMALAAYNYGSGNLSRDILKHGHAWRSFLPSETQNYVMRTLPTGQSGQFVSIILQNNTGGNVHASVNALGAH